MTGVPIITDLGYSHSWLISKSYKSFNSTLHIISAVEWLCVSPPYGELRGSCCCWFCHTHTSPLQMTVRIRTHPEDRLLAMFIMSPPIILNLAEQISSSVCWAKKKQKMTWSLMHWMYCSNYTKSSTLLRAQPRCTHVHRISVYSFWCVHHNKYIFIDGWYKFYMTVKRNDMCLTQILCSSRNKTLFTNTRKLLFVLLDIQLNICFACCTVHWITFCWVLLNTSIFLNL